LPSDGGRGMCGKRMSLNQTYIRDVKDMEANRV